MWRTFLNLKASVITYQILLPFLLFSGTQGSEIYEFSFGSGPLQNLHGSGPLVTGHFADELWGVAAHPRERKYCTVGDDGTLRMWDVCKRWDSLLHLPPKKYLLNEQLHMIELK